MNTHTPYLSVGLPVYNGEKYLAQALDAILKQTFTDFELIISDNASSDGTQAICEAYAARDARIRYYRNDHNLGAAPNFNAVVHQARGKYFRWAAYDDLLAPDLFEKCLAALGSHPEVIMAYPRVQLIDGQGVVQENYDPTPNVCAIDRPAERFGEFILHPHLALQLYGIYRTDVLKQTRLHRSFPSSDEVLLAELTLLGRFYEVPERLFFNRVHEEQSTKGALTTMRSRVGWIDTSLKQKVVLAHWMYFFDCLALIWHSSQSLGEKAYCYRVMARWLLRADHLRAMGKDVFLAVIKWASLLAKPAKPQLSS